MRVEVFITLVAVVLVFLCVNGLMSSSSRAEEVFEESGVSNLVTSVYLYQRVYDTVFEVLVFSLVVAGISLGVSRRGEFKEEVFKPLARVMAFFLGIASIYLALTGHVYPGGGFTAGVVVGTALLMMGMARGIDEFEGEFERYRVPTVEKVLLSVVVGVALMTLVFKTSKTVQLMNFLIYFKVMAGTWIVVHKFIKHRGIV